MHHFHRPWIPTLLAGVLFACEIRPFEDVEPPTLTNLQVGPGVTPTFSWTGDRADRITVRRLGDGETVWYVTHDAGMASPITYGIPPAGAKEQIRIEAVLTGGVTYEVELSATGFGALFEGVSVRRSFTP